jgi:hypothetical protein
LESISSLTTKVEEAAKKAAAISTQWEEKLKQAIEKEKSK